MAGLSPDEALRIAIELFRASMESHTAAGAPVLTTLEAAAKGGKITFVTLPMGMEGQQRGDSIQMNQYLINNPAKLSVWLVHEGFHLAAKRKSLEIDEEIGSRQLQGRYWQTLMRGITLEGKTYTVQSGAVLEMYSKDRIVDWVLSIPGYTDTEGFLTQGWIIAHIQDWGGPANREKNTRQLYITALLQPPDRLEIGPGARALFATLSSATPAEARGLITFAGGGDFAKGRKMIAERIGKVWGGSALIDQFTNDVVAWQNATGIDLGMVPRAR